MARLSEQLRYFVNKKVTEDADWQGVDIILSGHEVPGEGEHKIMEYIRLSKAQPGYNPNTRHCLYGLDADLIMLGLLSHDPHFCLLREEVKFGRMREKKTTKYAHYASSENTLTSNFDQWHRIYPLSIISNGSSMISFSWQYSLGTTSFLISPIFISKIMPCMPSLRFTKRFSQKLVHTLTIQVLSIPRHSKWCSIVSPRARPRCSIRRPLMLTGCNPRDHGGKKRPK
ncbi:XRN 5'-3' exonuclease N-terminus-domain-containing protein [Cantharellus anzutake]|uniref:XRN 5'-3' exonuclease N-terminus-domain-containing protein n=1 Tax=Cantharellus anzutake TaxID=1750568 RepID=UPI001907E30B|nr:XRN 5'-3' exonuclease N-terminus-domain-containing protein [Cantharellus anzutake]KAF8340317.1 XRN 5'-3' exonuclease N-terminus-domain-containing protein [Cantharellus anzutake]